MFRDQTILLIDDDPAILAVVGEGLRMKGCRVETCNLAKMGIKCAKEAAPDLIVLDVVLPDLSGLETCKALKSDPSTAGIPIIFLSAKDEPKARVQGLRAGAIDYVIKPFDLDELLTRIDIGLRVKAAAVAAPVPEEAVAPAEEAAAHAFFKDLNVLDNRLFSQKVEERVDRLDRTSGLLTLVYLRADQEALLSDEKVSELRDTVFRETLEILSDLAPKETILGEVDHLQVALLIPRKNKYGAELIVDELRNRLELHDYKNDGRDHRITFSAGVAEFPNPLVRNGKELEERAESALRRALRQGGDQTILL